MSILNKKETTPELKKENRNKRREENKKSLKESFSSKSFKMGGYSLAVSAVVIAIVIVVNIIMGAIPENYTKLDTTSQELYTLSEQTKNTADSLTEDVTLYYIAQNGAEVSIIKSLVDRYAGLSSHIKTKQIDPALYPNFTATYTSSEVDANSIIVVCGERSKVVAYDEMVITDYDYSTYYTTGQVSTTTSFAGENALTSAIAYVTGNDLPKVYTLTGHGEAALSEKLSSYLKTDNVDISDLSLVSNDGVPEDASTLIINSPSTDISADEAEKITDYLENGGSLMLLTNFVYDEQAGAEKSMPNLLGVAETYGLSLQTGIIIDMNSANYYQYPNYLLPAISSHEITTPSKEAGSSILMPVAQGIIINDNVRSTVKAATLLKTSENSYSKQNPQATTYEKEEGDVDGPFNTGVAVTESYNGTETKLVWFSCANMLSDGIDETVSGANTDLFRNSLSWLTGHESSISIRSKTLTASALTVNTTWFYIIGAVAVIIIPVGVIAAGLVIWLRRRRR